MKNMNFKRKLPVPKEIKEQYPLTPELARIKAARDAEIAEIFTGRSDRLGRYGTAGQGHRGTTVTQKDAV